MHEYMNLVMVNVHVSVVFIRYFVLKSIQTFIDVFEDIRILYR